MVVSLMGAVAPEEYVSVSQIDGRPIDGGYWFIDVDLETGIAYSRIGTSLACEPADPDDLPDNP